MEGHCKFCDGTFKVTKVTNEGDAGYSKDNETANYRLEIHDRTDTGGRCDNSELPPDSLE